MNIIDKIIGQLLGDKLQVSPLVLTINDSLKEDAVLYAKSCNCSLVCGSNYNTKGSCSCSGSCGGNYQKGGGCKCGGACGSST